MTHAPGRFPRFVPALLALACAMAAGCHEDSVAPRTISTPKGPMGELGTYIVDVDLKTRTVTARPTASGSLSAPAGVSAAFYGGPGTITHNFTVVGGGPDANNTFVMQERIENDLPFAIGTHAVHALGTFPQDTMGVFVFVLRGPVVTGGCTPDPVTCVVKADTAIDGTFPFTTPEAQPYMYFKTILEKGDGSPSAGLDYTNQSAIGGIDYFRTIGFHASAGVTHFYFEIAVSAAWVRPHQQPWVVRYLGDTLPDRIGTSLNSLRAKPDWRLAAVGVVDTSIQTTFCLNDGPPCLGLQNVAPTPALPTTIDSIVYFRSDSIGPTDTAFIQADIVTTGLKVTNPSVFLGMQDGVKAIHFGLASAQAGFTTDANDFIAGGSVAGSTTGANWRIVKYASDSVLAFKDGTRVIILAYTALPAAPTANAQNAYFWFGQRVKGAPAPNNPANVVSTWQNVIYTIGKNSP